MQHAGPPHNFTSKFFFFFSLVNFTPDKFSLKWEIKSLKHRNTGHQKTASNTSLVYACTKLILAGS